MYRPEDRLTKDLSDRSALIHGIASALGFFALLFLPLWRALLALETDSPVMAWACFAALGLALVFFTLFVLSDKDRFQGTAVAASQRLHHSRIHWR